MKIKKQNFKNGQILTHTMLNNIENSIEQVAKNSIEFDYVNNKILFYIEDTLVGSLPIEIANKITSLKILFVGNSFSANTSTYMYDFLSSLGFDDIDVSYLYIGSCTIDTHWANASKDKAAYKYWKWNKEWME